MFDFILIDGVGLVDGGEFFVEVFDDFCINLRDDGFLDIGVVEYDGDEVCVTISFYVFKFDDSDFFDEGGRVELSLEESIEVELVFEEGCVFESLFDTLVPVEVVFEFVELVDVGMLSSEFVFGVDFVGFVTSSGDGGGGCQ